MQMGIVGTPDDEDALRHVAFCKTLAKRIETRGSITCRLQRPCYKVHFRRECRVFCHRLKRYRLPGVYRAFTTFSIIDNFPSVRQGRDMLGD